MTVYSEERPFRVFSFGAGVQSTAILIMQALGMLKNPFDLYVFCNVGERAENPHTIKYLRDFVVPFALKHGINFTETARRNQKKETVDLYDFSVDTTKKGVPIPMRVDGGGFNQRKCTNDWKVLPFMKYIGQYAKEHNIEHVEIGIGFSVDEGRRRFNRIEGWHKDDGKIKTKYSRKFVYPLLDDIPMSRNDCINVFIANNLALAPKSSCFFCPFHSRSTWIEMKKNEPELFGKAVEMEAILKEKMSNGYMRSEVFLHRDAVPLESVKEQLSLWDEFWDKDESGCHTGYCGL